MNSVSALLNACTPSERLLVEHVLKLVEREETANKKREERLRIKSEALYKLSESFTSFFPEVRDARWEKWKQDNYPSLFALKTGAELPEGYERA